MFPYPSRARVSPRLSKTVRWLCPLLFLAIAASAGAGEEPAGDAALGGTEAGTAVVGDAKIRLILAPGVKSAPREGPSVGELIEEYRRRVAARFVAPAEKIAPSPEPEFRTLPDGNRRIRLPAELAHTMFLGPVADGMAPFCAKATVEKSAAPSRGGEDR